MTKTRKSIRPNRSMQTDKKAKRQCKYCGKEFFVYTSSLKKTNASGNFCCRKCYNEYQRTLTGDKNNHYTKVTVVCPNCGKSFQQIPSKVKAYKNVFCRAECKHAYMKNYTCGDKNPNWKGGASKYRGDFEEVKKQYFSGTQFCAICGTTKHIHIHHIIPYRLTQDNSTDNLIPLCVKHHKIIEIASLPFIELFENDGYEVAKEYMNVLLRQRQFETACYLKGLYDGLIH